MNPSDFQRIVIAGSARTGKTTLATQLGAELDCPVYGTDGGIGLPWSEVSDGVAGWLALPGPWIVEGVAAVRGLRKALAADPDATPCDLCIWLDQPRVALSKGQEAMRKGCRTIWAEVRPELLKRGVKLQLGIPPKWQPKV